MNVANCSKRARRFAWATAAALAVAGGCTEVVERQVIAYPQARAIPVRPVDCNVEYVRSEDALPSGCVAVGDVYVGDEGHSTNCARPRMLREASQALCPLGATHGWYWQVGPNQSVCYQLRAVGYACPDLEAAARGAGT